MGHQTVPLIIQIYPIYIGFDGSRTNGVAVAAKNAAASCGCECLNWPIVGRSLA